MVSAWWPTPATGAALVELDSRRVIAAGESDAISDTVLEVVAALIDD